MPRRPFLSCRQFRQLHAEFVDGYLCEERSQAMRAHGDACPACSRLDVQVRRSLLALQTLPMIEPSADFRKRLHERIVLSQMTPQVPTRVPMRGIRWGVAGVVTAASVAFLLLAAPARTTPPGVIEPAMARAPERVASVPTAASVALMESVISKPVAPARVAPSQDAARSAEAFRFEALPNVTAVRRSPSIVASPSVRLHLASYPGQ